MRQSKDSSGEHVIDEGVEASPNGTLILAQNPTHQIFKKHRKSKK